VLSRGRGMSNVGNTVVALERAGEIGSDIIRFDGVSKSFRNGASARRSGATRAIEGVSFSVRKGSFVALIGPSGCGKTTLLNLIAGLLPADQGSVIYDGAPVRGPNARVGYLTQLDALLPWRSVLGNVTLPLEIRQVPRRERIEAAVAIIKRVGLEGFERHFPGQLSGGMRKRVALARTLIYRPETLLLDEPFSALDAQTRVVIQRQLQTLAHELGLTIVLVTHDLNEAIALSDTIIVFSRRPARIIETMRVPNQQARRAPRIGDGAGALHDRIWTLLADQIDITAAS
jgi:NitT/TauT family transport system ATP-binding protein